MLALRENEIREIKSENSSIVIAKRELEENKKKHQDKVADLQKQLTAAYEEAKQLKIKQKDFKKDSDSKQQQIDELQTTIETIQSRHQRDQSHLLAESQGITQTLRSCQEALNKEREKVATLRGENDAVSNQCRKLNEKNSTLNVELEALKSRLQEVEGYVEKRIVDSNAGLRNFSQNTPTAKKSSFREEVRADNSGAFRAFEHGKRL